MTGVERKRSDLSSQLFIGSGMCLGYAALMLCRRTVSIAGPAMLLDEDLQLTKTTFGAILGWGIAGNPIGKLTNGVLSDRFGGHRVFVFALGLSAAVIGIFGAATEAKAFFALYSITLFSKSAGWPAMAVIIGSWFPTHHHGRMWGFISTSSRASSLGSTLLLAGLLYFVSWRWLHFLAAGITVCIILSLTKFFFPRNTGTTPEINLDPPTADPDADHPLRDQSRRVPTRAISQKAASDPRSTPLARSVI